MLTHMFIREVRKLANGQICCEFACNVERALKYITHLKSGEGFTHTFTAVDAGKHSF